MNLGTTDCDWRGDKVGAFYAHLSQAHRMKFLVAKEKVRAAVARHQRKNNPASTQPAAGKPKTHWVLGISGKGCVNCNWLQQMCFSNKISVLAARV